VQKAKDMRVNVNFIGWLDNKSPELKNLYETSSIFVFPSTAENFPTVLLEAMAAGCAIITTNSTGCHEVVGEAALLVRPKSSKDIKSALVRLISNDKLRNELLLNSRQRVQENFKWEKVSKNYINIYKNILNEE
jgi:glycosyltransferase involved in cell wall biosynthesis